MWVTCHPLFSFANRVAGFDATVFATDSTNAMQISPFIASPEGKLWPNLC